MNNEDATVSPSRVNDRGTTTQDHRPADQLNLGRKVAYVTFSETLGEYFGRDGVTEVKFRDSWLRRLRERETVSLNGWYDPPPSGIAVLFGDEHNFDRISFESLRLQKYWPSDATINWSRGLLYAYCSPVHVKIGLPGDFGLTLYFGSNPSVRDHFRDSLAVTHELLNTITPDVRSAELFERSERLFREFGLINTIASVTDSVPLDLGHSLPALPRTRQLLAGRELSVEAVEWLRGNRKFISGDSDWPLLDEGQVTVEPQLVSSKRRGVPQISVHYVVDVKPSGVTVLDECDELFGEYGLL